MEWREDGAREHQTVEQGDRDRHVDAPGQTADHAAPWRAAQVERLAIAGIHGWDDPWTAIRDKPDVADQPFVEDGERSGAVSNRALRVPLDLHRPSEIVAYVQFCTTTN